jgi:hypothetical protein
MQKIKICLLIQEILSNPSMSRKFTITKELSLDGSIQSGSAPDSGAGALWPYFDD